MRLAKDSSVDTQRSRSLQTIPVYSSTPGIAMPVGSIFFDVATNTFCGIDRTGAIVPIGSRESTTFPVGVNPAGLAITSDSKFAFVANNNNYSIAGQDCVTVLDLTTGLPSYTIHDGSFFGPYTVTINAAGTRVYVCNSTGETITMIDPATGLVTGVIAGFDGPSGMAINETTHIGYVNNYGAGSSGMITGSISATTLTVASNTGGSPITIGTILTTDCTFTGSIAGTILSVTSVASGAIAVGATISGSGVIATTIASFGSGTGNVGTYNIVQTQTVSSETITSTGAAGSVVTGGTTVTGFLSGTGGVGTYTVSPSQSVNLTTIGISIGGAGSGNGNTVSVVDLINNVITATVTVGQAPAAIAITPAGDFVYTANYIDGNVNTGTLTKIRTSNNMTTNIGPFVPGFSGPFTIEITPDGTRAVVTNFGSNNFEPFGNTVAVMNLTTELIVATITLGIQPAGLAITADGSKALVSNYNTLYGYVTPFPNVSFNNLTPGQGTVQTIDLVSYAVLSPTIPVGQSPANIAIAPNGQHAYVTNYTSGTVIEITL